MMRMIIVDDHSAFGQALELVLGRTNDTEVVLARTVEEGKALIRGNGRFDLAVLDLMLPDGDGTELVAEVKRHHPDMRPWRSSAPGTTSLRSPPRRGPTRRYPKRRPCPA